MKPLKAIDLKRALKAAGIDTKDIRIEKSSGGISTSFLVRIFNNLADTESINKVLFPFQTIRRCEETGDILGGGNTFIIVQKVWRLGLK